MEGFILVIERGILGLRKGTTYQKYIEYVDTPPNTICEKIYQIMALKEPDYVMLMMNKYRMLDNLEASETHRRYKGPGGEVVRKRFYYHEVFVNHFHYHHQGNEKK